MDEKDIKSLASVVYKLEKKLHDPSLTDEEETKIQKDIMKEMSAIRSLDDFFTFDNEIMKLTIKEKGELAWQIKPS